MKKLFVILLAVALTLSVAVVASAVEAKINMNGQVEFNYTISPSTTTPMNFNFNKNMQLGKIIVNVSDDHTWAQLNWNFNSWGSGSEYGLGFTKIGDILDLGFWANGWDKSSTVIGQSNLRNLYGVFDEDPLFTNRPSNILAVAVNTDAFSANLEYVPNALTYEDTKADTSKVNLEAQAGNLYFAVTGKFDGGQVYAGYAKENLLNANDVTVGTTTTPGDGFLYDKTQLLVGGSYKFGSTNVGLDYFVVSADSVATATVIQAFADFTEAKAKVTVYDETVANIYGLGLEYTGIEKTTLGAKYFSDNKIEAYGAYQVGVVTLKLDYTADTAAGTNVIGLGFKAGLW